MRRNLGNVKGKRSKEGCLIKVVTSKYFVKRYYGKFRKIHTGAPAIEYFLVKLEQVLLILHLSEFGSHFPCKYEDLASTVLVDMLVHIVHLFFIYFVQSFAIPR